jgi:N-acylneuraminate cytidylyltransferase
MEQVPDHDYVVLLQPTSPLRTAEDIDATIARCHKTDAPTCVTVTETDKPPQWMYTLNEDHRLRSVVDSGERVTRRQEAQTTYALNGAVYVAYTEWLRDSESFLSERTLGLVMPKERSVDVDTKLDLEWCEHLASRITSIHSRVG